MPLKTPEQRFMMSRTYDIAAAKRKALTAAGAA